MATFKSDLLDVVQYRLELILRMVSFLVVLLLFGGLGLMDAGLCLLWPAWRARECAPNWASTKLVYALLKLFPLMLLVPCHWPRRQYRVLRLNYPRLLRAGESACVELSIQNFSGEPWHGGGGFPFRIGVIEPLDESVFHVPGRWPSAVRPAELRDGAKVPLAEVVDLRVPIQAPSTPGRYREVWGLLIEGRNWVPTLRALEIEIVVEREG